MTTMERNIEAILLFKNEPLSVKELVKVLSCDEKEVMEAVNNLQEFYKDRGIVIVFDGQYMSFGTHPNVSSLIEEIQKEELSRDLGRAGLETLTIILYRGPVSRREIDYIRGVNSTYSLRNLQIRGLVDRVDTPDVRGYSYKPTLKLLQHLGITKREELPNFETAYGKVEEFVKDSEQTQNDE